MRLSPLAFAAILTALTALPAAAQSAEPSPTGGDTASSAEQPAAPDPADLPVSLDRIRERLARPPERSLKNLDIKADFVVRIEERDHIIAVLSKLQVPPSAPSPGGGLYGYEQQRMAFPKNQYPLMQPYAAFTGGQMVTLAIEGLAQKYLGDLAGKAVSNLARARAERSARAELATAISEYCDAQPNGGRELHLCTEALTP